MGRRRAVITGLGPVTPIGLGKEGFWNALLEGKSGITHVEFPGFDMQNFRTRIGAPIKDLPFDRFFPPKKGDRYLGRTSRFALVGAKMALEDAGFRLREDKGGFEIEGERPEEWGTILGVGSDAIEIMEATYQNLREHGSPRRISPFALPNVYASSVASLVSERFNIKGATFVVSSACASGSHAIAAAYLRLQEGQEKVFITGGADACITPLSYAGFIAMRAMSTRNDEPQRASRPFDLERDGFVMGEGAGVLILEELEHALRRGARIYAELVGYGMTADAYHIAEPDPEATSLARAIAMALDSWGIAPEEVDYINAHGTSTKLNDVAETKAIKRVFGPYAYQIPISSTKSMTGHLIGGAGGIEAIATALTISNHIIHPTINYEHPDPECDLDYVPWTPRQKEVKVALSISAGFGGVNCVLALRAFEG